MSDTRMSDNTNVWRHSADIYRPDTVSAQSPVLPPGLYRYEADPNGWWLHRTHPRFEFPFKVYGTQQPILDRIRDAWDKLQGNLGVLLNGVKGTGKTVTAQQVANWAIDKGYPVLVVHGPVPLTDIIEYVNQPIVVLFDEFEKTHTKNENGRDHQQALLTAIDGMSRSQHSRLFIFTTNTARMDENFIDRPSRIRYCWNFGNKLDEDVLDAILDDMLDPTLAAHRDAILAYISTRAVQSIDVVKTVIGEVNTFRTPPETFSAIMNLTEMDAHGYILEIVDDAGNVIKPLTRHFMPYGDLMRSMLTRAGRANAIMQMERVHPQVIEIQGNYTAYALALVAPTKTPDVWACQVKIPWYETWVKKCSKVDTWVDAEAGWLDAKPDGWEIPTWARAMQEGATLNQEQIDARTLWNEHGTIYGNEAKLVVLVRITPNREPRNLWGGPGVGVKTTVDFGNF